MAVGEVDTHLGHWHIQDMRVVRSSGPELISAKISTEQIFQCQ
jgi:hypothetical protein